MDVTSIAFNKLIGLAEADDARFLLMLPAGEKYLNHVGTVHASALFALAEATSGALLFSELADRDDLGAVVRRVETKYRNPASGAVYSTAALVEDKALLMSEIGGRGRAFAHVAVELFDGVEKAGIGTGTGIETGTRTGVTEAGSGAEKSAGKGAAKTVARFEFEWYITEIQR